MQQMRLSQYGVTYDDEDRVSQTIDAVKRTVPAKIIRKKARLGSRVEELRMVGTTAAWFELVPRRVLAGRVLATADIDNRNGVVVLTESGARKLLATGSTVGKSINMEGSGYFDVVGIIQSESGGDSDSGLPTPDQNVDAYVPITVARERLGDMTVEISSGNLRREQVQLHQLIIEVEEQHLVPAVAEALERVLNRYHPTADFSMIVPLKLLEQAQATKRTFNIVLGSIAGISLLVGGIGIMNIMLASVTERTREIGIRRAIGAKRRQIVGQFLIETVVLSTVGGAIGIGLGVGIPQVIEYYAEMPTSVEPWMIGLSAGISMLVGIVFGLYPAVRAANLDPIQALRHE
jgi:putative ABC transport system permease protein